jgi:hypothetical protein
LLFLVAGVGQRWQECYINSLNPAAILPIAGFIKHHGGIFLLMPDVCNNKRFD